MFFKSLHQSLTLAAFLIAAGAAQAGIAPCTTAAEFSAVSSDPGIVGFPALTIIGSASSLVIRNAGGSRYDVASSFASGLSGGCFNAIPDLCATHAFETSSGCALSAGPGGVEGAIAGLSAAGVAPLGATDRSGSVAQTFSLASQSICPGFVAGHRLG